MKNVLLIDDDPDLLEVLEGRLRSGGLQVWTVSDGNQACSMCREHAIEVVVTDMSMPARNGLDVITEIKREFPTMRIIAMSGYRTENKNYLKIAQWSGAESILVKPFKPSELVQRIISGPPPRDDGDRGITLTSSPE